MLLYAVTSCTQQHVFLVLQQCSRIDHLLQHAHLSGTLSSSKQVLYAGHQSAHAEAYRQGHYCEVYKEDAQSGVC